MFAAFDNDNAIRVIFADRYKLEEFCRNLQHFGLGFTFYLNGGFGADDFDGLFFDDVGVTVM